METQLNEKFTRIIIDPACAEMTDHRLLQSFPRKRMSDFNRMCKLTPQLFQLTFLKMHSIKAALPQYALYPGLSCSIPGLSCSVAVNLWFYPGTKL
jgi:hypothetical protein